MPDPEFEIPVRDLDAAGKPFHFPVRAAWLRGALEGTAVGASEQDGRLDLRLSRSGTDVVVRGTLEAYVSAPCARCLEPAPVVVKETISALAVPATTSRESPGGKDDDVDVRYDAFDYRADLVRGVGRRPSTTPDAIGAASSAARTTTTSRPSRPTSSPTTGKPWCWTTSSATSCSSASP